MGWYDDGGSMMGSGIYSKDVTLNVECPECTWVFSWDCTTNDWGNIEEEVICEKCKHEFTYENDGSYGEEY